MKVLSVVGDRPHLVHLGPIAQVLRQHGQVQHVVVHTGQHYDPMLSDVFFRDLGIDAPVDHLGVGGSSPGRQTGELLAKLDAVLEEHTPDWVLCVGDDNAAVATALSCAKNPKVRMARLQAGLRSFRRTASDEVNRAVTDRVADLLLVPTRVAMDNLAREGLAGRAVYTGDVMADVCLSTNAAVAGDPLPLPAGVTPQDPYAIATIHRPENTDSPGRLKGILDVLRRAELPVVLVTHPRLAALSNRHGLRLSGGSIHQSLSLRYPEMTRLLSGAAGAVTDSTGLQKEAFLLGVPVTTLRRETECPETLTAQRNVLDVALDTLPDGIVRTIGNAPSPHPYGDGRSARNVVDAILAA
ncbi:MAG: UDP-N-acetyl glucosamine 2-epimerase [Arachnia sp.]